MKKQSILISIITYLILTSFFAFANSNLDSKEQCYNYNNPNNPSINQCNIHEDPAIFVLKALFSNTQNASPIELWENRDNNQLNIFDIAKEIKSIAEFKDKILNNPNDPNHAILLQRLSQMEDIADKTLLMQADQWTPTYVNQLMKHIIGIRHAGISNLISTTLNPNNCDDAASHKIINPCSKNGNDWLLLSQHLIDHNNEHFSISNYMAQHNADIQQIKEWWRQQLGSSWNAEPLKLKQFFANQRTLNPETYYWKKIAHPSESTHPNSPSFDNTTTNSYTIWHAYVQEILDKTKFYHNDHTQKQLCLIRTISQNALKSNGITQYGTNYTMPNAVYDSFSLFNVFRPRSSNAIIESSVPHHRVFHLYPLLGHPNDSRALYETEVIVLSGPDLPFDYFYDVDKSNLLFLETSLHDDVGVCKGTRMTAPSYLRHKFSQFLTQLTQNLYSYN